MVSLWATDKVAPHIIGQSQCNASFSFGPIMIRRREIGRYQCCVCACAAATVSYPQGPAVSLSPGVVVPYQRRVPVCQSPMSSSPPSSNQTAQVCIRGGGRKTENSKHTIYQADVYF